MTTRCYTLGFPVLPRIETLAARVEQDGWDGLLLTDSQNLSQDTFVALALAAKATSSLELGTGVTNPVMRHPAVVASAIASIHQLTSGRAVLGVGRGDSALFHIGLEPAPVRTLERFLDRLQGYLRGDEVDIGGHPSRNRWIRALGLPKVPVDVAATGPKVIAAAARRCERVTFAVGADPARVRWGIERATAAAPSGARISFGAYVSCCPLEDADIACDLVRGGASVFAHFSGMGGAVAESASDADREVFARVDGSYEREHHARSTGEQARLLDRGFLQRFAVLGSPDACVERLRALVDAGAQRLVFVGLSPEQHPEQAAEARRRLVAEVLPHLRS